MELTVAIRLITKGVDTTTLQQTWADLGAGSGLFTRALSSLIPSGNIYAIDKEKNDKPRTEENAVTIQQVNADFVTQEIEIGLCDGILMANSLHYVFDKPVFIGKIRQKLKPKGVLLIVEYDRDQSNPWVPYPIRFRDLEKLMLNNGFVSVEKIGEEPSKFDRSIMYAAVIRQV